MLNPTQDNQNPDRRYLNEPLIGNPHAINAEGDPENPEDEEEAEEGNQIQPAPRRSCLCVSREANGNFRIFCVRNLTKEYLVMLSLCIVLLLIILCFIVFSP